MPEPGDRDEPLYIQQMCSYPLHRVVPFVMLCVGLGLATQAVAGATLEVLDVEPRAHSLLASVATPIVVRFDRAIERDSLVTGRRISAFGRWSGAVGGAYAFSHGDTTVTLTPDRPFSSGENVMVVVSTKHEDSFGAGRKRLRIERRICGAAYCRESGGRRDKQEHVRFQRLMAH